MATENQDELRRQAADAGLSRLWAHTVGVANNIRITGTDPGTGRRADEETMGTGCAAQWGDHYFVITAGHVPHEKARATDLRIYWRPTGALERRAVEQVALEDVSDAISITDPTAVLYRCDWADLAVITINPETAGPYTEFFDIARESIDPVQGSFVHCVGFPRDRGFLVDRKVSSDHEERFIGLSPWIFTGQVLAEPTAQELKFKITEYDSAKHYLIPYADSERGFDPLGFSGAATWCESERELAVWRPSFKFAGICSCCYEKGAKEQVIKASAVKRFLEELFGPTAKI
jgi:hypothetical protein